MLSLDGKIAGLTDARVNFDIDQDGKADSLPGLSEGSGFVALDRNGNGTIDDGGELFGARSGNGFGELATLDEDGNGVLDERDSQFSALQFWQPEQSPSPWWSWGSAPSCCILSIPPSTIWGKLQSGVLRQSGLYVTEQGKEAGCSRSTCGSDPCTRMANPVADAARQRALHHQRPESDSVQLGGVDVEAPAHPLGLGPPLQLLHRPIQQLGQWRPVWPLHQQLHAELARLAPMKPLMGPST